MYSKVKATIEKFRMIQPGETVLIAVSGGPDSMALAHVLHKLAGELDLNLHVAHLNHMFRGREAEIDTETVIRFCEKLGLQVIFEAIDVPAYLKGRNISTQMGARDVRYSFLKRVANDLGAEKIATGHQADDQAEAVLLNLIRGCGVSGLSGIPPIRDRFFVRPLIEIFRQEILSYCEENQIPFRHDQSNQKGIYLRNKVRNSLIPFIREEFNPQIEKVLNRLSNIAREDNDCLDMIVGEQWKQLVADEKDGGIVITLKNFRELPCAIQRRLLLKGWEKVNCSDRDLGFIHVEKLLDFLNKGPSTGIVELPRGIRVRKSYGEFVIFKDKLVNPPNFRYELKVPGDTLVPELGITIRTSFTTNGEFVGQEGAVYVDCDLLPGKLFVRNRRPGDRFSPKGMNGTKKLKEFFIDTKIPVELRDKYAILTTDDEIVWVAGLRQDQRWMINEQTSRIIEIKIFPEVDS